MLFAVTPLDEVLAWLTGLGDPDPDPPPPDAVVDEDDDGVEEPHAAVTTSTTAIAKNVPTFARDWRRTLWGLLRAGIAAGSNRIRELMSVAPWCRARCRR